MRERADHRQKEGTEDRHPEPTDFKALDHSTQQPEQEAVDDESENAQRQNIERKREDDENRFDRDINQSPQKRQEKRCPKSFDQNPRNQIRQCQKREGTDEPTKQEHTLVH